MAYANYNRMVRILQQAVWYDVSVLLNELKAIRRINFSIVEQRQQALERINAIAIDGPFGAAVRFPDNSDYVCEILGDWSRKFQQLKSALSFKERDLRTQGIPSDKVHADQGSVSDAQQAFWNATTAMLDQIRNLDYVWERVSFENRYNMDWR